MTKPPIDTGCTFLFFFIALSLIAIFAVSGMDFDSTPTIHTSSSASTFVDSYDACAYAHVFVKRQLKAPSTAKFPYCSEATIVHDGNTWTVLSYVDAQNSFGAMLRSEFIAEMEYRPSSDEWYPTNVVIRQE